MATCALAMESLVRAYVKRIIMAMALATVVVVETVVWSRTA